jgi:hypothetical protein
MHDITKDWNAGQEYDTFYMLLWNFLIHLLNMLRLLSSSSLIY